MNEICPHFQSFARASVPDKHSIWMIYNSIWNKRIFGKYRICQEKVVIYAMQLSSSCFLKSLIISECEWAQPGSRYMAPWTWRALVSQCFIFAFALQQISPVRIRKVFVCVCVCFSIPNSSLVCQKSIVYVAVADPLSEKLIKTEFKRRCKQF